MIVGAVNTWPAPAGPAGQVPAVWVSRGGAPLSRSLLPDRSGASATGYVHDITATEGRYVASAGPTDWLDPGSAMISTASCVA